MRDIIREFFDPFVLYPKFFEFCSDEMVFSYNIFSQDIFIIKKSFYDVAQVRYYHFTIVKIIAESASLIQMSK